MASEFLLRFEVLLAVALFIPALTLAILAVLHKNIVFWRYASAGMFLISVSAALTTDNPASASAELTLVAHLICLLGYYLCSKSLREIYNFRKWAWLEVAAVLVFGCTFVLMTWNQSSYEYLAATLSLSIMYFSSFWGLLAIHSWRYEKKFTTAIIIAIFIVYGSVTAMRALSGFQLSGSVFSLTFWDQVFVMASLTVTILFALAQIMYGNDLLQKESAQKLKEATNFLTRERDLTYKLKASNKEQRNLQKLLLHEFKRPLSAIQAILQLDDITKGSERVKKIERLRILTQQANTYLEGISQYEDISELLNAPNLNLVHVSEIANDIKTKWDVRVIMDDQLGSQELLCDALLLDIAAGNLIENAKKFAKKLESVSVRLECFAGQLRLDVADDGPGVPTAEWENIWQKFYKLDDATSTVLTGCGLGLYIVDQVAKVHGGHTNVVSENPSVIRLVLPLKHKAASDD
jgi:signal transduction histidine kinase